MRKKKFSGYLMVVLCFAFIFVHMGVINSLGVFMPVIVEENGFSTTQVSLLFSFAGIGAALTGMFITPPALKKFGPRKCMMTSTVLAAIHMLWYGLASHLVEFFISAVIAGIAIGIGIYAATGAIIGNWFVKNRMTMIGIIGAGSGLGSALFNAAIGSTIPVLGYHNTYFVLAGVVLVVGFALQIGLRSRPSDVGQEALGAELAAEASSTQKDTLPGVTFSQAKRSPSFYLVFAAGIFGNIAWTAVNMYVVTLLRSNYGLGLDVSSRYDAVLRGCMAIALIFSGKIAEKLGTRGYILYSALTLGSGALIILLTKSSIITMPVLLVITLMLLSVGGAQGSANGQILANGIFGPRDFPTIQSYLLAGLNVGLASSAFVAAPFVSDTGSVLNCFALSLFCTIMWAILSLTGAALSPYKKKK